MITKHTDGKKLPCKIKDIKNYLIFSYIGLKIDIFIDLRSWLDKLNK